MSFLKTYINYIMQPAKQVSESGTFGNFLSDLHPPTQDDAFAVRNSESGKDSFSSFDKSCSAGQFNERPVLSSEKSPAVVPSGTGHSSPKIRFSKVFLPEEESGTALWVTSRQLAPATDNSKPLTETGDPGSDQEVRQRPAEIRFSNDSLPEEESGVASWVASRQLAPGTDDLKPLTEMGRPGEDQEVRQRLVEIFKTNIIAEIPRTDDPGREEKTGPEGNPEARNDSGLTSRPAPERFETGESGDAGRNPDPVPEPVRPVKLTNKDSGKNLEGNIPQKKTGAIEQQNRVNEGRPRVEASDDRLEKIFPHRAEPVQNRLSKTVPQAREIPQVRIGHINVLVEDRSKANARPGPGRAAAAPPPNIFGLKGV